MGDYVQIITNAPSLTQALDDNSIFWASDEALPWFAQTTTTHDGTDAAQSGPIADNQESRLKATVIGPATLSFWWRVDSEEYFDFLIFEMDDQWPIEPISGDTDWAWQTITIPPGTHHISWIYSKDEVESEGLDAGFLDEVTLTKLTPGQAGAPLPRLESIVSGRKLRLSWTDAAAGFRLQSTPSLGNPNWQEVPANQISPAFGEFFTVRDTSSGTAFFRLIR